MLLLVSFFVSEPVVHLSKRSSSANVYTLRLHVQRRAPVGLLKRDGVAEWLASQTRNREVAGLSPAFARKL
jgi:hypothetical protein